MPGGKKSQKLNRILKTNGTSAKIDHTTLKETLEYSLIVRVIP